MFAFNVNRSAKIYIKTEIDVYFCVTAPNTNGTMVFLTSINWLKVDCCSSLLQWYFDDSDKSSSLFFYVRVFHIQSMEKC